MTTATSKDYFEANGEAGSDSFRIRGVMQCRAKFSSKAISASLGSKDNSQQPIWEETIL